LRELAQLLHLLAQRLDLTVHRLQRLHTHTTHSTTRAQNPHSHSPYDKTKP
jgi:hypothetical protein